MNETHYSPLPLVAVGANEEQQSSVTLERSEVQHDWLAMYSKPRLGSKIPSEGATTVMLDEFEIDIAIRENRACAISGQIPLRKYRPLVGFPSLLPRDPVSVRMVLDVEPEVGHVYEYPDHFQFRFISGHGCYVGKAPIDDIPSWAFCSAGFWVGIDNNNESSLSALLIPFDEAGSIIYEEVTNSRKYRAMTMLGDLLGRK